MSQCEWAAGGWENEGLSAGTSHWHQAGLEDRGVGGQPRTLALSLLPWVAGHLCILSNTNHLFKVLMGYSGCKRDKWLKCGHTRGDWEQPVCTPGSWLLPARPQFRALARWETGSRSLRNMAHVFLVPAVGSATNPASCPGVCTRSSAPSPPHLPLALGPRWGEQDKIERLPGSGIGQGAPSTSLPTCKDGYVCSPALPVLQTTVRSSVSHQHWRSEIK